MREKGVDTHTHFIIDLELGRFEPSTFRTFDLSNLRQEDIRCRSLSQSDPLGLCHSGALHGEHRGTKRYHSTASLPPPPLLEGVGAMPQCVLPSIKVVCFDNHFV